MRIKVLFDSKKGQSSLDQHFGLIKDLLTRYPNAVWRKIRGKNGQTGYELDI